MWCPGEDSNLHSHYRNQALNGAPPPDPARSPGGVFVYCVYGVYRFHNLRKMRISRPPRGPDEPRGADVL